MTLKVQPTYVTDVNSKIEPYLYVCHTSSDDRHWGTRHDRHLLYTQGRDCSSWHICRSLSRPTVRHMLCLLGGMLCLLRRDGRLLCLLLGDGRLLCLLLGDGSLLCLLLGNGRLLCLLLGDGRLLCLLMGDGRLLCLLLRNGTLLCLLLRNVTPDRSIGCISGLTTRMSS